MNNAKKKPWSLMNTIIERLQNKTKNELAELIAEEASRNSRFASELEERLKIVKPLREIIITTKSAIAAATYFDEKYRNYNFEVDYEAYTVVKRNFQQLIESDHLEVALELAVDLMEQGSYQVEGSDEGLMTEVIEECFQILTNKIYASELNKGPESIRIAQWCNEMASADRVEFIFEKQLSELINTCT